MVLGDHLESETATLPPTSILGGTHGGLLKPRVLCFAVMLAHDNFGWMDKHLHHPVQSI